MEIRTVSDFFFGFNQYGSLHGCIPDRTTVMMRLSPIRQVLLAAVKQGTNDRRHCSKLYYVHEAIPSYDRVVSISGSLWAHALWHFVGEQLVGLAALDPAMLRAGHRHALVARVAF